MAFENAGRTYKIALQRPVPSYHFSPSHSDPTLTSNDNVMASPPDDISVAQSTTGPILEDDQATGALSKNTQAIPLGDQLARFDNNDNEEKRSQPDSMAASVQTIGEASSRVPRTDVDVTEFEEALETEAESDKGTDVPLAPPATTKGTEPRARGILTGPYERGRPRPKPKPNSDYLGGTSSNLTPGSSIPSKFERHDN